VKFIFTIEAEVLTFNGCKGITCVVKCHKPIVVPVTQRSTLLVSATVNSNFFMSNF